VILEPIVRLLLQARDFFHDPEGHDAFLAAQGVDYVVLLAAGHVGYREPIGTPDGAAIARLPSLRQVFTNDGMTIYRVTSSSAPGRRPDPAEYPGYECRRSPIAT
jgi:hypothetical protein